MTAVAPSLAPTMSESGELVFRDAAGVVVFTIPTPVPWDFSGVAGKSSEAVANPRASLAAAGKGAWE